MISADTIAALEAEKIEYILGVRERTSREVREEVIEDDGVACRSPSRARRARPNSRSGSRRSPGGAMSSAATRRKPERMPRRAPSSSPVSSASCAGRQGAGRQQGLPPLPQDARRRRLHHRSRQGRGRCRSTAVFVLRTNTKIAALQVVLRYRNLLAVEDAFKTAKALLATRPIFHKTDAGIRGHVFCTFLALVLRKELIDRLAARPRQTVEWQRIVDDLADLSEIEVEQDGRARPTAHRSRPDHRSGLPRHRHYPAARLPGDAARSA